ncbi:MAG: arginine--tRNA ligase [Bacteroidota bacterium]
MILEKEIISKIKDAFQVVFGSELAEGQVTLQPTRKEFDGTHTVVCFPLARFSKTGPEQTAEKLGEQLIETSDLFSRYNVVKGFLNLSLNHECWISVFQGLNDDPNPGKLESTGQEVMVEYSSPNTNKPLHLGHLRNNFLGWSVSEILKAAGNTVHKVQIINDRGIHICKSMVAWLKFGEGETPESSGKKGDKLVGDYYVRFDQEYKKQIAELVEDYAKHDDRVSSLKKPFHWVNQIDKKLKEGKEVSDEEQGILLILKTFIKKAEANAPLIQEAKDLLLRWESKEPAVYDLWKQMNGWVYSGFDTTYETMGVDFDKLYYESDTYLLGKDEVLRGLERGVFFKKEDGSVWVDLSDKGLDQKLLLRSDGTSVYMTQDIGTAILRFRGFPAIARQVYTVGNEQEYHFKVLFLILEKLGYAWAKECYHLSYGMVDLPSGKMKSREGTVVDADDLMQEMLDTAEEHTKELGKIEGFTDDQARELYYNLGLGALKYFLLKVDPKKRMLFDPNESIQFQGHTGPFIQYTHARISAILRKATQIGLDDLGDSLAKLENLEPVEISVIKLLSDFKEKIKEAAHHYSPDVIAQYAYELAKEYNRFYQEISIFNEENTHKLKFRIAFSRLTAQTISQAMALLGIKVPERM